MKNWPLALGMLFAAVPGLAQHAPGDAPPAMHDNSHGHGMSPYGGMQQREIKALSERQLADLRAGKGMSMALPAELNGYPGPAHALELQGALGLNEGQQRKTQQLFARMQDETKLLGQQMIAAEYELDRLFRDTKADAASVEDATAKAALAQGRLRAAHLKYHLEMREVLTPAQIARYDELRGYR